MSFKDSIQISSLENKATSNKKYKHIPSLLAVTAVKINLRDGPFTFDVGIVYSYPKKRIELHTIIKAFSIRVVVHLPKNYLVLILNEMGFAIL